MKEMPEFDRVHNRLQNLILSFALIFTPTPPLYPPSFLSFKSNNSAYLIPPAMQQSKQISNFISHAGTQKSNQNGTFLSSSLEFNWILEKIDSLMSSN